MIVDSLCTKKARRSTCGYMIGNKLSVCPSTQTTSHLVSLITEPDWSSQGTYDESSKLNNSTTYEAHTYACVHAVMQSLLLNATRNADMQYQTHTCKIQRDVYFQS